MGHYASGTKVILGGSETPGNHFNWIYPPEAAAYTIQDIVQKVRKAIEKGLGVDGIVLTEQLSGQQRVRLYHTTFPSGSYLFAQSGEHAAQMGDQEKIKALAEKIKAALPATSLTPQKWKL